jgi:hypothetical protein
MNNRIEEIEARLNAATPGPWTVEYETDCCGEPEYPYAIVGPSNDGVKRSPHKPGTPFYDTWHNKASEIAELNIADADFIAHSPEDIAYLLSALKTAQAEAALFSAACDTDDETIERLKAERDAAQARADAAVELAIQLLRLCFNAEAKKNEVFRRMHIGVGDYMGSGYAFVDAFTKIWSEFLETGDENIYQEIVKALEWRGPQEGVL